MNALLNYPGAKWGMAEEIVSLMEDYRQCLVAYSKRPLLAGWRHVLKRRG